MAIDWGRYVPKEAVVFEEEIPKKLRFKSISEGTVIAHKEGVIEPIPMPSLIFDVTREDDKPVIKKWYCASKKAIMTMKPYVENGTYKTREFTITKHGKAPLSYYEIVLGALV